MMFSDLNLPVGMILGYALLILLTAAMICFIFTLLVRKVALNFQWVDIPNERSSHTQPKPRLGGVAIFATLVIFWVIIGYFLNNRGDLTFSKLRIILLPLTLLFIFGIADDIKGLTNSQKLIGQLLAAFLFFYESRETSFMKWVFDSSLYFTVIKLVLTIIWIVGVINIYNFLDGIDGLATGVGILGLLFFGFSSCYLGNFYVFNFSMLICGSLAGFFIHNYPPAKIFLGDSGSMLIGFIVAIFPLLLVNQSIPLSISMFLIILNFGVFLFDATWTILRRFRKGENIFRAHRTHIYQRLVILGYSHRHVDWMIYIMTFSFCIISLFFPFVSIFLRIIFLCIVALILWGYSKLPFMEEQNITTFPGNLVLRLSHWLRE